MLRSNIIIGIPILCSDSLRSRSESSIHCLWKSEKSGALVTRGSKLYIASTGRRLLSHIERASVRGWWSLIRRSRLYQTRMIFCFSCIFLNNIWQLPSLFSTFFDSRRISDRLDTSWIHAWLIDREFSWLVWLDNGDNKIKSSDRRTTEIQSRFMRVPSLWWSSLHQVVYHCDRSCLTR